MNNRNLCAGLVVLASSMFLLAGTASAAPGTDPGTCVVHSLTNFVAQGEFGTTSTAGDIIEVECNPNIYGTGSKIKITASQLKSRCEKLIWYVPNEFKSNEFRRVEAAGVSVGLDADGNATVA
ncbi:MAG: hypothetical protein ABSG95_12225, partial [Solirubrobacteraceae bacterium]